MEAVLTCRTAMRKNTTVPVKCALTLFLTTKYTAAAVRSSGGLWPVYRWTGPIEHRQTKLVGRSHEERQPLVNL